MAVDKYNTFTGKSICRELLDSIKVGDYVKFDNDKRGMKVWGVSANYILAGTKSFNGRFIYTIIHKVMWRGQYNYMNRDTFIHGPDNMIFGYLHEHAYELDNEEFVKDYMEDLERGEIGLSRRSVSFYTLRVRRADD